MNSILQHAIERVERPGGSHEGVGRKKNLTGMHPLLVTKLAQLVGLLKRQASIKVKNKSTSSNARKYLH